jgi:hypothetical protein
MSVTWQRSDAGRLGQAARTHKDSGASVRSASTPAATCIASRSMRHGCRAVQFICRAGRGVRGRTRQSVVAAVLVGLRERRQRPMQAARGAPGYAGSPEPLRKFSRPRKYCLPMEPGFL